MTHICFSKLTIIGSDNGLSPVRCQAIIWTNAGMLLIGPFGTNFSEIVIGIYTFSSQKMHLKMSSGKWRPFCPGLSELSVGTSASRMMTMYGVGAKKRRNPSALAMELRLSFTNPSTYSVQALAGIPLNIDLIFVYRYVFNNCDRENDTETHFTWNVWAHNPNLVKS